MLASLVSLISPTLILLLPLAAQAPIAAPPWAVTQVKQFDGLGFTHCSCVGIESPISVATPNGDVYAGSNSPPEASPTRQYGDVSNGGAFVLKVNAAGSTPFLVEIGGAVISAIAADSAGNAYIAGLAPPGLPVTGGAYSSVASGDRTGYVCKLKTDGALAFCTYLNGASLSITAMAVDAKGNVYISGTGRTVVPTPGALSQGSGHVFVIKLAASGSQLVYCAVFGGSDSDSPGPMAVDAAGNVYLSGLTFSSNFPVTADAAIGTFPQGADNFASFLTVLNAPGNALAYSSFGKVEFSVSLAVDSSGNVYLGGSGRTDQSVFVRKYAGHGPAVTYDKSFPGSNLNVATALAVDETGIASLVGYTNSVDFPLHRPSQVCNFASSLDLGLGLDAFLIRVSPGGDVLQSTYLVPSGTRTPFAVAFSSGKGYIVSDFASNGRSMQFSVLTLAPSSANAATLPFACIGSAASLLAGVLAPGQIVSLFGEGLGPAEALSGQLDPAQRLSTILAGTQVTFDDVPAPLLYAQASQINAIIPWSLAGKTSTEVCVSVRGTKTNCIATMVQRAAPAVFQTSPSMAVARNQDGTLNSPQHPASLGSIVTVYATGLGPIGPPPADGAFIQLPLPAQNDPVQVRS